MTVASTYRTDARVALATLLDNFRIANPTLLNQTYRARPGTLHPPCAFIGDWREPTIALDMSIVTRLPLVDLVLVQGEYDNAETMDRQDVLTDAFLSYLANNAHQGNGVITRLSTSDAEVTFSAPGGLVVHYLTTIVAVELDIQEGGL